MSKYLLIPLLLAALLMTACTNSSSDSDSDSGSDSGSDSVGDRIEGEFRSDCGVVRDDTLVNPVDAEDGEVGSVEVQSANLVIFRDGEKSILVKLHGLRAVNDFRAELAMSRLRELTRGSVLYYQASEDCTTSVSGGGTAFAGQIYTSDGRSINEMMLREGLADTEFGEDCFGELIISCYDAVEEDGTEFGGTVSNFLWKPVSERDGNLVVLMSPGGARVFVNGQMLIDFGASNGRGTTVRANQPGCGFGANIIVEALDSDGRILLWPGGAESYTISNGCERVEFQ